MSKKNRTLSTSPEAPTAPAEAPQGQAPAPGQVQLFALDPQVGVLLVHPIVVETLRVRMGLAELEGKVRNLEGQLTVANTYVSSLMNRVQDLEQRLARAPKS